VGGVGQAPATWILGDLTKLEFEVFEVDKALEMQPAALPA
jgi:hypothetical protein